MLSVYSKIAQKGGSTLSRYFARLAPQGSRLRLYGSVVRVSTKLVIRGLRDVALAGRAAKAGLLFSRSAAAVLRNTPQWLLAQTRSSYALARALANRNIVSAIRKSPRTTEAIAKYSNVIKGSKYYQIGGTMRYSNTLVSVSQLAFAKFIRFAARRPYAAAGLAAGAAGSSVLAASYIFRDPQSWLDEETFAELMRDSALVPTDEDAKYEMTEPEYEQARLRFYASVQQFFPEINMAQFTDSEMTDFFVSLVNSDAVGGFQILLSALTESGLLDPSVDSVPATLMAALYDALASNPNVEEDELAWFGELLDVTLSAADVKDELIDASDRRAQAFISMPDPEDYERSKDSLMDFRHQADSIRDLDLILGSRQRLVQLAAFVMALEDKRQNGEDVYEYLNWLLEASTTRIR